MEHKKNFSEIEKKSLVIDIYGSISDLKKTYSERKNLLWTINPTSKVIRISPCYTTQEFIIKHSTLDSEADNADTVGTVLNRHISFRGGNYPTSQFEIKQTIENF